MPTFGGAADHEPGDKHRENGEQQEPVDTRADVADDDLPKLSNSGIMPPSAVKLSCIAFTAPHEASVVTVANSADAAMPNRTSLPSMFAPGTPSWCSTGLPAASAP